MSVIESKIKSTSPDELICRRSVLRIQNNGNIGIGTSNPADPFHLAMTNGDIRIDAETDRNHILSRNAGNSDWRDICISATSGQDQLILDTNGRVGIGTSSPSSKLQVNGGHLRVDNSGGTDNYYLEFYESGAQRFRIYENSNNVYFDGGPGNTHFRPRQGGGSNNFIVTGADVGIGTSNPGQKLDVNGTAKADEFVSLVNTSNSGITRDWTLIGTGDRGAGLEIADISGAKYAIYAGGYEAF